MVGLLALGCVSGSNTYYPLQKRPVLPRAIVEPDKVWLYCGANTGHPDMVTADMFCIDPIYVEQLRKYIIEMDALVSKYENTLETHNSSVD